ncbi:toprim domain-containing protein [Caldibacillus thermoamylovorans]|uniref:toprim domain-containing protein n=1 Tax=Caldibacillus thermoamylovorans TaxID=35841 RepID=UPI00204087DB|nr:toprim domain-containing protein [Caldibacillus thermoamylovorans]MCM3797850.1 toprim domain-containing protein [Caldibacillus thermoamylovorans]
MEEAVEKVIIVEGKSDKKKVQEVINESVEIICTNGTIGLSKLDELIDMLYDKEVFVLFDADDSGDKLRKQFKREFPEAKHIYIDRAYREVASAPENHVATVLLQANIQVHSKYLL